MRHLDEIGRCKILDCDNDYDNNNDRDLDFDFAPSAILSAPTARPIPAQANGLGHALERLSFWSDPMAKLRSDSFNMIDSNMNSSFSFTNLNLKYPIKPSTSETSHPRYLFHLNLPRPVSMKSPAKVHLRLVNFTDQQINESIPQPNSVGSKTILRMN